jgi:hypothetical protein
MALLTGRNDILGAEVIRSAPNGKTAEETS